MEYSLNEDIFDKIGNKIKLLFVPTDENNYSPKFLQSRFLYYFVVLLLVTRVLFISISLNFPQYIFFADIAKTDLVKMINEERGLLGLNSLAENTKLDKVAQLKAKDMLANGYFSHTSPAGINPWFWFKKIGYNYKYAGENLAIGFTESLDVYNAWFDSDSHRENFLSSNYTEVGTAILTGNFDGSQATIVVQVFGKQKTQIVKATTIKPQPIQQPITPPSNSNMIIKTEAGKDLEFSVKKEVLSAQDTSLTISKADESLEKNLQSKILNIVFYRYDEFLQRFIFWFFVFISLISILNIGVNYNFQNRNLVLKSFLMVLLLCFGTFIDKNMVLGLF